ncbi:MAG: hypothetical protein ACQKBU_00415, partial [Verrucomicrobiales bacterium]
MLERTFKRLVLVGLFLIVSGCGWGGRDGWRGAIDHQVGQLGYRNWIVIAESSFPAHSRPGTRQVNTYQAIPEVLDEVLRTLERSEHVRPKIYVSREMNLVENDYAPGIQQLRVDVTQALHAYETVELEHDSIVTLMLDAQRSFDVLVLRTTTALPYSSVFLELQPGYWDGEAEARLREIMR